MSETLFKTSNIVYTKKIFITILVLFHVNIRALTGLEWNDVYASFSELESAIIVLT